MKKRICVCLMTCLLVLSLAGCGPLKMEDKVADAYVEDILDAIEDQDADEIYDLFMEGSVEYEDVEDIMEPLGGIWNNEEYTYSLTYMGIKANAGLGGNYTLKERRYKIETEDHTYTMELAYIEDEGLYSFRLNY